MSRHIKDFSDALEVARASALDFLNQMDERPSTLSADLATLRARLRKPLGADGVAPATVVADLVRDTADGFTASAGGRFFGWVIGGSLPAALAADWLTSAWDQNGGMYATSPAAAVVEEVAGEWLKEVLQLPSSASFALVTGCQMAHATCLVAARRRVLLNKGWDAEEQGLFGAPPIRILTSRQMHGSFKRATRFLGLGEKQIVQLDSDEQDRLLPSALEEALARDRNAPTIVLLQAGDINIAAFDDFAALIPIARKYGAWVHVDGAFGLWVNASPQLRHFTRGVELADSWATDGHKWLNVPFDCGYAFVTDREAHRGALSHRAVYLTHAEDARDQVDWNPEWSRRSRGFATYAALRQLGKNGVASLIERCCHHARELSVQIGALPGAQLVFAATTNQGLVRFLDPRPGATEEDHNRRTDEVIAAVQAGREAFFSGSNWRGRRVMRISVCNWQTDEDDVRRSVAAVAEAIAQVNAETSAEVAGRK